MQAFVSILLALSALPAVMPFSLPSCQNTTAPTDFTITGFQSFYPSASNTEHPHSVSFKFADSVTNGLSYCSSINTTYSSLSSDSIPCGEIPVYFRWNGTEGSSGGYLTIEQTYCYGNEEDDNRVKGEVYLATDCIPSEPPMPLGFGTLCQSPTVSETGHLSKTSSD